MITAAQDIMRQAIALMREGTSGKARRHANNAYKAAAAVMRGGQSNGGVSEALKAATDHLYNANVEHTAKLKGTGEIPSGEIQIIGVDPTAAHDSWVHETNEGLKNGR